MTVVPTMADLAAREEAWLRAEWDRQEGWSVVEFMVAFEPVKVSLKAFAELIEGEAP